VGAAPAPCDAMSASDAEWACHAVAVNWAGSNGCALIGGNECRGVEPHAAVI